MKNLELPEFEFFLEEGLYWLEKKDYEGAIESFEKALGSNPECLEAYHYIALAYMEADNLQEALNSAQIALNKAKFILSKETVGPWWLDVRTQPYLKALKILGLVHCKLKNYEEGIAHFCQLLDLNPQDSLEVAGLLGEAYLRDGQIKNALDFYQLIEDSLKGEATLLDSLQPKKKMVEAKEYEKQFQKFWPNNPEGQKKFFDYLSREKEESPPIYTFNSAFSYNLGLAYFLSKNTKIGKQKWRQALKSNIYVPYFLFDEPLQNPSNEGQESLEPHQEEWYALNYVETFGDFWMEHLDALKSLKAIWVEICG